jgi:hypothetical protein
MATITFTDGTGAVTLDNGTTAISTGVGSRFTDWTPFQKPIGPRVPALGTGRPFQFRFRTDYGASFSLTDIPNTKMSDMLRCQEWLLRGEAVAVNTGDASNRSYATCYLAPDGDVSITLQDKNLLLYSMSFVLINGASSPVAMLCIYD